VEWDLASVQPKWEVGKKTFFENFANQLNSLATIDVVSIENLFKTLAAEQNIKVGELQMIFRVMLVGSKMGPGVFVIAQKQLAAQKP
jgi:glutamyl-tRNA synthetase